MHTYSLALALALYTTAISAVHLAVSPTCGSGFSGPVADVNKGLKTSIREYDRVISFGDSYSAINGSGLSNGPSWIQHMASAGGVPLTDMAVNGSVVDADYYPALSAGRDFNGQIQSSMPGILYPPAGTSTLFTVFFGAQDFINSDGFSDPTPDSVTGSFIYALEELTSSPIFATDILVIDNYGRGKSTPAGETFKEDVFAGLGGLAARTPNLNIGYVDLSTVWDGVLGTTPGMESFGYTAIGPCVSATGGAACASPSTTFYWIGQNPTTATSGIIADYVNAVLTNCTV